MIHLREDCFTQTQLSEQTGFAESTLATWRSRGKGPRFVRIMGRIYYPKDAVQEWLEAEMSAA